MAAKLARLSHKIVIKLHLVAESCTICSSRSRRPFRRLLDTLSYLKTIDRLLVYRRIAVAVMVEELGLE
jgi:hypothetical protein